MRRNKSGGKRPLNGQLQCKNVLRILWNEKCGFGAESHENVICNICIWIIYADCNCQSWKRPKRNEYN